VAGVTSTDSDRYGHWADAVWADAGGAMLRLGCGVGAVEFLEDGAGAAAPPRLQAVLSAAWQTVAG
jgi:hypothetical protein